MGHDQPLQVHGDKFNYGELIGSGIGGAIGGGLGQGFGKLAGNISGSLGKIAFGVRANEAVTPFAILPPILGNKFGDPGSASSSDGDFTGDDGAEIVVTAQRPGSSKPASISVPTSSGGPGASLVGIGGIRAGSTGIPDFNIPWVGSNPGEVTVGGEVPVGPS